ncbi:hypothetical protein [Pseudoxanthomonas dokdonensis]|uniref:DUF1269 domain-containing protein n=1 Tax=Pseudoxanthomonas dokdonensis TaxID=344882 RepID=A0A0R0CFP9_9GAMM|nr:hypothetical protein [Pseudoxanthomonas dokdonensis]KRG68589.1 hypothetical protein ABB29_12400 [Pseudoxanthomonas dokdonensis]
MSRRIFCAPDISTAEAALSAAIRAGIAPAHAALVAESHIETALVPDEQKQGTATDFGPAAVRGLVFGAVVGLLVGLVGMHLPAVGFTAIGVVLTTVGGALVGGWAASLAGSSVPNAVRRDYDGELAAGKLLLVIDDSDDDALELATRAALAAGTVPMNPHGHGLLQ